MAKYKIIPSSRTIVQSPISIGHKAEKGVEAIEFDLTAWVETYGSGTLTVIMRRWGDAIPYPIALEIDENNKATWTLSDIDTAKAGMAYAQLSYIVGETVVKKSDIYTFRVMDSLTGEGEPPEAYESWLEHLTHLAAEAMAEVLDIEGIVTDKTLTIDGGIADAKSTGDALALKADKSTTYTKTEVDQMIEDVEVETDTTLEVAGAAADAAETGRQIGLLKADLEQQVSDLRKTNSYDVLRSATHESRTVNDVTFTWNSDNTVCTASGTSTGIARSRFFNDQTAMPDWLTAGQRYYLKYQSTGIAPSLYVTFYANGTKIFEKYFKADAILDVPSTATGCIFALSVNNGYTVDGTVSLQLLTGKTNEYLSEQSTIANTNAKMISFGNSILTGSVWRNGSASGLVEYDNAPYALVAKKLGVTEGNVNHTLISNTGLIYDAGSGSFLTNIKNTNLSGYDYLLTMLWTSDLESTYGLGTKGDSASDTTLAGAVVDLVTYMHTSNGNCQLILVGPPPVSYTHKGATVFTEVYANGFNIHDVNVLMTEMAEKYHFVYLDWEHMALSYYYQDYTDGDNLHANNADTYRVMGEYLANCIEYQFADEKTLIFSRNTKKYNCCDLLRDFAQYKSRTLYGVAFTWNAEHTQCTAVGTADGGRAYTNLYNDSTSLPVGIVAGNHYQIRYKTSDKKFALIFGLYKSGSLDKEVAYNSDGILELPSDCTGMYIRLYVNNENTVNATASEIAILNTLTNEEIAKKIKDDELFSTDFLKLYGTFEDITNRYGIDFDWTGQTCHVSGTSTATANCNIYYDFLPKGMNPGDNFIIRYESDSNAIGVRYYFYDSNANTVGSGSGSGIDIPFTVPDGAVKWLFRIYVNSGKTLDNYLTRIQVIKLHPKKMDVPLIFSIIDDDASNDELVTKFHDSCCHNGVKGNYAVIIKNIEDGYTTASKLLGYEDEGFGTLIHCYQQAGATEWNTTPRTDAVTNACRANLAKGMRQMQELGFVNYNFWVTPGGHHEKDLVEMSKQLDNKCLISTNNNRHNSMQDFDRWYIKRISLKSDDNGITENSMAGVKAFIDSTVAAGGGWLIITTHFNDGWDSLTWDTTLDTNGYPIGYARFNEMVQYAISKGMIPMSIPQAWQYYEPILNANRVECNKANA